MAQQTRAYNPMLRRGNKVSGHGSAPIEPEPATPPAPEDGPRLPDVRPLTRIDLPDVPPVTAADVDLSEMVRGALQVQALRIEQLAKILETTTKQQTQVMETMLDTIQILQDAWGQFDETAEKLGRVVAALIKLYEVEDDRQ